MINCKWPGLYVTGKNVSKDLAAEIIIRTSELSTTCNARRLDYARFQMLGILDENSDPRYPRCDYNKLEDVQSKLNFVPLSHLDNRQICSAWIGGPHGWIDWDGTVGCAEYNIGKWPNIEDVCTDAERIAEAFPMLNLEIRLLDREWGEEEEGARFTDLIVVADGKAVHTDIDEPCEVRRDRLAFEKKMRSRFSSDVDFGEYGISLADLRKHLDRMGFFGAVGA